MTRCRCQASRSCAQVCSSTSLLRSTPMISAPSAADSGRTASADGLSVVSVCVGLVSIPVAPHGGQLAAAATALVRRDYGPRASLFSRFLGVDQDEGDAAGLGAAVDPGMVGALLHQHVAGLEMNLVIVEQHVDLARHYDGVVDGASAMHGRMPRREAALGCAVAEALMHGV